MAAVVVIWGLGPPVTKLITAPPLVGASMRFWLSIPVVWAAAYASGRPMSWSILRRTAVAGTLFAANLVFLFAALPHVSIAVLSVILALQPGVVLIVAAPLLDERPTRWHVMWTIVGVGGVGLVILGGEPEVRGSVLGIVLAVGTMLTFTAYYLLNRRVRSGTDMDSVQWIAGVTLVAGIALTPVALLGTTVDDYRRLGGPDWLYLGFVAVGVGVIGHTMMSWCHKFIPASRSSLYLLMMHVIAIAAAWPLHDEPVTWTQGIGGAVVLGAVGAVVSRPAAARAVGPLVRYE